MKAPLLLACSTLLLTACSGMGSLQGPSAAEIAKLPVVRYGSPAPADQNFVLYYPPGVDLPITAKVGGNLLEKPVEARMAVRIRQGVYVYRDQVSFDGLNWHPSQEKFAGRFWVYSPGDNPNQRDAVSPGELGASFDVK